MNLKQLAATFLSFAFAAPALAHLVDSAWLEGELGREDIVLIDTSPAKAYAAGHIAGALNMDVFSFGADPATPAQMQGRIQSWGISPGKRVVLYDQGGTYLATSLYHDLLYHGFPAEAMFVLDGGMARWRALGKAVSKDAVAKPTPGTFRVTQLREETRVSLPEFLVASGDPAHHALVEALEAPMHFGGARFFDRAGHIPNAILTPTADFFNADKTFKSPAEIRRMLAYLGATPDKTLYTHCGGGIAASVPFFAARVLAGYPQVKLYKGSQLEWLRDDRNLPFWAYDAPNLVRERSWVNGWNSPMMRMFGVSKMSIVDVRPAEAFRQLHLPFALNVPAETFRKHLGDPARLAAALGAAGVDPAFEAVVVDRGLTPDSALAFVALESLGQKRVSVLPESVEEWGLAGLPTEKAGAEPKPGAAALVPVGYAPAPRADIVIRDAKASSGLYPKVFVATGKAAPARAPEGTVVHIPYTELLDGTRPKAAKDLWSVLTKAGVPRYAELVALADDPGEASVGYVVLKMMGYPDVKVLVP